MEQAACAVAEGFEPRRGTQSRRALGAPVLALLMARRGLALAFVAAPALLVVLSALGLPSWRCPFHALTGLECPGCGLTRAVVCLARGEWAAAMAHHPFAPLLLLGWLVVAVSCVLPDAMRRVATRWVGWFEARTGLVMLVLVAFAGHGAVRLIVQALAALS